ncbi:MAG: mmdD [Bacillota bacterium]|nr:mmdD [Bacillota bacterium]
MERFADPEMIQGLSSSELVQGALITTLMGMGTTFVVLTLLWAIIAFVSNIINKSEGKPQGPTAAPTAPTASSPSAPAAAQTTSASAATGTGTELIAVIAAAIAALEGTSPNHLIIRKISRVSGNSTPWSRAGASEIIDSRKF